MTHLSISTVAEGKKPTQHAKGEHKDIAQPPEHNNRKAKSQTLDTQLIAPHKNISNPTSLSHFKTDRNKQRKINI